MKLPNAVVTNWMILSTNRAILQIFNKDLHYLWVEWVEWCSIIYKIYAYRVYARDTHEVWDFISTLSTTPPSFREVISILFCDTATLRQIKSKSIRVPRMRVCGTRGVFRKLLSQCRSLYVFVLFHIEMQRYKIFDRNASISPIIFAIF